MPVLPAIARRSRANAMKFPAKVDVQIVADNMKYFATDYLALGIAQLQLFGRDYINTLECHLLVMCLLTSMNLEFRSIDAKL